MPEQIDVKAELKVATDRVLASKSRKKARRSRTRSGQDLSLSRTPRVCRWIHLNRGSFSHLSTRSRMTLSENLGDASRVFTLHGYCQYVLRHDEHLRSGLSAQFRCYPGLRHLKPKTGHSFCDSDSPHFVDLMRDLNLQTSRISFYLDRANYYDASILTTAFIAHIDS